MRYYFIKSPLLLVLSLIVPSCSVPAEREAHSIAATQKAADPDSRNGKDRPISVDGIVELY
jgi:hypothetical protein